MRRPRNFTNIETGRIDWWDEEIDEFVEKPVMEVMIIPGAYTPVELTTFTWNVTKWQQNRIDVQVYFDHYDFISTFDYPDMIRIIFYDSHSFRDNNFGIPVVGGPDSRKGHQVLFNILPEQLPPLNG